MNRKPDLRYLFTLFFIFPFFVSLQFASADTPAVLQDLEQEQKERLSEISLITESVNQADVSGADLLSFREAVFRHRASEIDLQTRLNGMERDILARISEIDIDEPVEGETTPSEFNDQILALKTQLRTVNQLQLQSTVALTEIAQIFRTITDIRKQRFFDGVLKPRSSFRTLLSGGDAIVALAGIPRDLIRAVENWWRDLLGTERKLRALAVVAIALILSTAVIRYFPALIKTGMNVSVAADEGLSTSAKRVFMDTLPPVISSTIIYVAILLSGMGGDLVATFTGRVLLSLVLFLYVSSFCRVVLGAILRGELGPKIKKENVAGIKFWVLTGFGAYGLLLVVRSTPLTVELVSFWVTLTSIVAAVSIIAATHRNRWLCDDGTNLLNTKVNVAGYIAFALIIGALGLGYIALLDLALRTIAAGLVLLSAMWLLRSLLRSELRKAMREYQTSLLSTGGDTAGEVEQPNFLLFWLLLLVDFVLVLLFVPIILVAAGIEWLDIYATGRQALSGFSVGGVTLSVTGIFAALLTFLSILVATHLVQRALEKTVFPRTRLDDGVRNSFKTLVGYFGAVLAATMAIGVLGLDLSSLAIIIGALSVGIGFGLQSIVNNFVSGVILLFERPVKVGDWVVTNSGEGVVRRISVRSTEIETFDRLSIIVPNSELISNTVQNWTHKDKVGRITVPVSVSYKSDPKKVREILLQCAAAHPLVLKDPPPYIYWKEFGESSLDFEVRVFLRDIYSIVHVRNDLRFEIFDALKRNDIEIPFPQRDVHLINNAR